MSTNLYEELVIDDLTGHLQMLKNTTLAILISGKVDLRKYLCNELANRGMDLHCQWIGFPKARALADQLTDIGPAIERIAAEELGIKTLETRRADSLDFHSVAVWSVKRALQRAASIGGTLRQQEGGEAAPDNADGAPRQRRDPGA